MSIKVLIKRAGNKVNLVKEFQKWGAYVIAEDKDTSAKACLVADEIKDEASFVAADIVIDWPPHPFCSDKAEFYRFCRRHGFNVPNTWLADSDQKFIGKKRNGSGSKDQFIIDRSVIVQEFIDWPEYSIDYFANKDGIPLFCQPRKRLDIVDGESKGCELSCDEILIQEGIRMGTELGIKGPACMQLFYNGTDIKWIEVNPRYGGGSHFTWHIFSGPRWQVEEFKMREANVSTSKSTSMH